MSGLFKEYFVPQVERSLPVDIIPSEVMKRLSIGIATSSANSKHKPFEGSLGILSFEIHAPWRGREMSISTTGVIVPERKCIEIKTSADSREFILILGMVFFLLVYFVLRDFSSKGLGSVIACTVVFLTAALCLYGFGWLSVQVHSSRHVQFIREAVGSPTGFDWARYRKQLVWDFWVYSAVAVVTVAIITLWGKFLLGF